MTYWESEQTKETFQDWLDSFNGSIQCGCDHGCNQWIKEQETKTALILMVVKSKGNTNLDKIAQMIPKRANKIWLRISKWQMQKFNRELKLEKNK